MAGPAEVAYVLFMTSQTQFYLNSVDSHGPMLIGTAFNVLLFGIMITQVYIYYTNYRR
jgi:hypothetical protein